MIGALFNLLSLDASWMPAKGHVVSWVLGRQQVGDLGLGDVARAFTCTRLTLLLLSLCGQAPAWMTQVVCLPCLTSQAKRLVLCSLSHHKNLISGSSYYHFKEKEPRPGKEESHESGPSACY